MVVKEKYSYHSDNIPVNIAIESKKEEFVLQYNVEISQVSKHTEILLDKIRDELVGKVKLTISEINDPKKIQYVRDKFKDTIIYLINKYLPDIEKTTQEFFTTYLMHKSFGLGKIEILLDDINLEEIVINNASEPVWVYHHKHGWLKTNITLENEEIIKHYSSLIGRRIGRSITLLTPLLDAHLETGDRVNATLSPISTKGNTITLRKFASKPITITNFILNKVISLSAASLIWMGVEYELSTIVSGGTASGKTSFLNAICSFMPPNQRIISVEDSVTGDSEILYKEDNEIKKDKIENIIDPEINNKEKIALMDGTEVVENNKIRVFSMDKDGKIKLTKPRLLIRHKIKKPILDIKLASGRKISITKDHSLFGLVNNKITKVKCSGLKEGDFIATPRKLDYKGNEKIIDLTLHLNKFGNFMVKGEKISSLIKRYGKIYVKNKSNRQYYRNKSIVPTKVFKRLLRHLNERDKLNLELLPKGGNKEGKVPLPLIIKIDNLFSVIIGMWLADGCYDKRSILISDPNNKSLNIIKKFANRYNARVKLHSDKVTSMINSKALRVVFEHVLQLKGNAYTKKVPNWIFNLKKDLTASLLKGYFSGDGTVKKHEISVNSSSMQLLKDIQTLLLRFEIPLRVSWRLRKDKTYESRISSTKFLNIFKENIGFIQSYKNLKLNEIIKKNIHDVSDVIPLHKESYLNLKHLLGNSLKSKLKYTTWKSWHGRYGKSNIGRRYLNLLIKSSNIQALSILNNEEVKDFIKLSNNDLFWDRIIKVKQRGYEGYVYDLSVPNNESFVCNNIVAHNTREIQLPKYLHWIPMVTRQPNVEGKGEVTMLDLILNSLRMRPDRIVVGEIRRKREAETLFEAMHTGHSVYATLHANDANETITRLVNPPIEVPRALLPAISMIIVMYRNRRTGVRRVLQVSEILEDSRPNVLLQLDIRQDKILNANNSEKLMPELQMQTGLNQTEINENLKEKNLILRWLAKNKIDNLNDIGRVIATYYTNKNSLMEFIKKNV